MMKIRIASCNLQNFHQHSSQEKKENFIKALIEDLNLPDIIALQEIAVQTEIDWSPYQPIQATVIATEIIEEIQKQTQIEYHFYEIAPLANHSGGAQDLNIRSAFLVKSSIPVIDCYPLISLEDTASSNNNDEHPFIKSRIPLVLKVNVGNTSLTLVNCHLKSQHAPTNQEKKIAKKQRNAQARLITKILMPENSDNSREKLIILGDLNDTPNSDTLKILTENRLNSIWSKMQGRLYTTKHKNCPVVLDYILVDTDLNIGDPQIFHLNTNIKSQNRFSDHDPIAIDLYL